MEQTREPMNKNRIGGIRRRTSGRMTAKSRSIKGAGCRSGGCARKAVELTSGDPPFGPGNGTGGRAIGPEPAAEVSRGHSSRRGGEGPNGPRKGVKGVASRRCDS